MCETRDQPLTATAGAPAPDQQWSRHVWVGPPVSGESQVSWPPWAGTGLCAQNASPYHRISHQPPFTRTPGWAGLTKQTSWTNLEWFGRAPCPPCAPSRGYWVAESVGKSIPLAVGWGAGRLSVLPVQGLACPRGWSGSTFAGDLPPTWAPPTRAGVQGTGPVDWL